MKYLILGLMMISGLVSADPYHHHHHINPIVPFGIGLAGGIAIQQVFIPPPRYEYREYYIPPPRPIYYNRPVPVVIWCSYYNNYIQENVYCPY